MENARVKISLALHDAELSSHLFGGTFTDLGWDMTEVGLLALFLEDERFDPPAIEQTGGWAA
jgi:hypothetical protein